MKFPLRWCGLLATLPLLAGCNSPSGPDLFTVRQIDSSSSASGGVRVKLTTPGNFAEADESLLVAYVKIVAIHEATRQQKSLATERARSIERGTTSRTRPARVRYLAISTELSSSAKGRQFSESVMLWDTQSEGIVGRYVYDIAAPPAKGRLVKFDTYSAEYVGSGL